MEFRSLSLLRLFAEELRVKKLLSISDYLMLKSITSPEGVYGFKSVGSSTLAANSFLTVTMDVCTASYREDKEKFLTFGKYSTYPITFSMVVGLTRCFSKSDKVKKARS
jgi:hypothetical protein